MISSLCTIVHSSMSGNLNGEQILKIILTNYEFNTLLKRLASMIKLNMISARESNSYAHPAVVSLSNEIEISLAIAAH